MAGISRTFKDISLSFKRHPVTNDIISLKNEDAIKRSIQNIVLTMVGEKAFVPYFGTNVNDSLFNLNTSVEAVGLKEQITTAINNFEPRVENVKVEVDPSVDENEFEILVVYDIVGQEFPTQEYSFILEATR